MNQVDKELMQEKGILTENEKADEYEIQKAAMKEAVFFLAAMLEKNLDMSELQTISLYGRSGSTLSREALPVLCEGYH